MNKITLQLELHNLKVDLALPGSGVSVITGASGAGKTTLLRSVAGLEPRVRGRVEINGALWQDDSLAVFLPTYQRPVGFVFQEPSLFPHLSVQKNIEFGLHRIAAAKRTTALAEAVELLGIGALLARSPATLSGGEKQRVAIARALATCPELLLMDEPLASLDEQRKSEFLPYLDRLHQEFDMPILYVTHAIDEVSRLADYVVLLENGAVRAADSIAQIMTRTDLPLAQGELACALLTATVIAYDPQYQLTEVEFSGGRFWLASVKAAIGTKVRLRIQARDVSLSLRPLAGSSILNAVEAVVCAFSDDGPGLLSVELDAHGTRLLARITRKSADHLKIGVGMALFAQIKGVAILK